MKDTIEEDILALATTKLTLDSELSKIDGDEPSANGGSKEGEEVTEKKVKNSLLKQIRAKLEQTEGEEAQALATQMAQQPQQAQSNERGAKTEPSEVRVEA